MKTLFLILATLCLFQTFTTKVTKIKRNRQTRALHPERKLNDLEDQHEANKHENFVMMMKMLDRQKQIKKIMALTNNFQNQLDDLSESVNSEIATLGSVASRV